MFPFTVGDINYPANWLRLSTAQEKKAAMELQRLLTIQHMIHVFIGVMELQKHLDDVNEVDENGDPVLDENGNQGCYFRC